MKEVKSLVLEVREEQGSEGRGGGGGESEGGGLLEQKIGMR